MLKNQKSEKHSIGVRLLSLFLMAVMLFLFVPTVIYAEIIDSFSNNELTDQDTINEPTSSEKSEDTSPIYSYKGVSYEETELREETVKHFKLDNGSYVAAQYGIPVHYTDENGVWKDIDNSLSEISGVYANETARIKFAKKINGSAVLFTLKDGNTKLEMSLVGATKGVVPTVINGEDAEEDTVLQKLMNLEKLSSRIIYPEILDGVDVEYIAHSLNVKENIIVKERKDSYSYSFELKLNGLAASLAENGDVEIFDTKSGDIAYVIPAPVVYDAAYEIAPDSCAYFELEEKNNKYILTVHADESWINSEERQFPIIIDPSINAANEPNVSDTIISTLSPDTPFVKYSLLPIKSNNAGYWKLTTLPTLSSGAVISDAQIIFPYHSSAGRFFPVLQVSKVTSDWNEDTFCYNRLKYTGEGTYAETITDYTEISSNMTYDFDITSIVQEWYANPQNNHGIRIEYYSEQSYNNTFGLNITVRLVSHSPSPNDVNADYDKKPTVITPSVVINYISTCGTEDYWMSATQNAGDTGIGNVCYSSGMLNFDIPLTSTTDGLFGYTSSIVYNSYNAGKEYKINTACAANQENFLPKGFKLNCCEGIKKTYTDTSKTTFYFNYEDSDGTIHKFYQSEQDDSIYVDDDGLGLQLQICDNNTLTITNIKTKNRYTFTQSENFLANETELWVLTKIIDKSSNSLNIIYTGDLVSKITLTPSNANYSIDYIHFIYDENALLCAVYNEASKELKVIDQSSEGMLFITCAYGNENTTMSNVYEFINNFSEDSGFVHAKYSIYSCNSNGYLTSVFDSETEYAIIYSWDNNRICEITEKVGENIGQTVVFSFNKSDRVDVRTSGADDIINTGDDITTRYNYDRNGRIISYYSFMQNGEIITSVSGEYDTGSSSKNNIKTVTDIGTPMPNLISNGDFERNMAGWSYIGNVSLYSQIPNFDGFGENCIQLIGNNTINGVDVACLSSISQIIPLKKATYTLSFPYMSFYCETASAFVRIYDSSTLVEVHRSPITLTKDLGAGMSSFFATTFTIDNDGHYIVEIGLEGSEACSPSPAMRINNIMLGNASGALKYNLVYNGGFENNDSGWSSNAFTTIDQVVETNEIFKNYLSISSFSTIIPSASAKQTIYTAPQSILSYYGSSEQISNANMSFAVSGFGKAYTTKKDDFYIGINVYYYQGENTESKVIEHKFNFLNYQSDWQYVSGCFSAEYVGEDEYDYNVVEKIELILYYGESNGKESAFFDNISVIDTSVSGNERHYYDNNGNLVKFDAGFNVEYYSYDAYNNLTEFRNNYGELIQYEYNDKNILTSKTTYEYEYLFGEINGVEQWYEATTPKSRTIYEYNQYGLLVSEETFEINYNDNGEIVKSDGNTTITQEYVYCIDGASKLFGVCIRETNSSGKSTKYIYDSNTTLLLAVINENEETGLCYIYNDNRDLYLVLPANYIENTVEYTEVTDSNYAIYLYDEMGYLSDLITTTTSYTFSYDCFGNRTSIAAGDFVITGYEYNQNNGKIKKVTYSNGLELEYIYNSLELVKEIWYNYNDGANILAYEYEYTVYGNLVKFKNNLIGKTYVYSYDNNDRVIEYVVSDEYNKNNFSTSYVYDEFSRIDFVTYTLDYLAGQSWDSLSTSHYFTYSSEGAVTREHFYSSLYNMWGDYTYDKLGRISSKKYSIARLSLSISSDYEYSEVGTSGTTMLVSSYTNKINNNVTSSYSYQYDESGNIISVTQGDKLITYEYDRFHQLIRENNPYSNETYIFSYDDSGNILSKKIYDYSTSIAPTSLKKEVIYSYANDSWADRLTSYDGIFITYDEIGNPINYRNNFTFEWSGRTLIKATNNNTECLFTYDDEGNRTSKTKNNVTTYYYYSGNALVAEISSNGEVVTYMYDTFGTPLGFSYRSSNNASGEWQSFFYEKNVQGDIVGICDSNGTLLARYAYDAWGNLTYSEFLNGGASTAVTKNNLFYRGYVYDRDLELYCLKTRYYDSVTGRFISPDDISVTTATPLGLTDKNLYAYCDNNPVMRVDYGGEFWWIAIAATALIAGVVNTVVAYRSEKTDKHFNLESVITSAAINTIGDVATVMFPTAAPLICAATNGLDTLAENLIDEDKSHKPIGEMISETVFASVAGFLDGVTVRALGITSEMTNKQIFKEAAKSYISGIIPDWIKRMHQEFWLDRVI